MKKGYAITNLVIIIGLIIWNYSANTLGINGNTVGSLSDEYRNLFTPAGYAFAIWGLIFLGLMANAIFQVSAAFRAERSDDFITDLGPWLIIANLANGAWVWFWLNEQTLLSVFVMLLILVSLIICVINLGMEISEVSNQILWWVWWPISIYCGWIAVATIANIAAYLAKIQWQAWFSEVNWTIVMIIVAMVLNMLMLYLRNLRGFALVGVWSLTAIAVRHWQSIPILQWTALIGAILILMAAVIAIIRNWRGISRA